MSYIIIRMKQVNVILSSQAGNNCHLSNATPSEAGKDCVFGLFQPTVVVNDVNYDTMSLRITEYI